MKRGSTELKVGIFVTAALIVGGILVFVLGNRSAMFASRVEYETVFTEVSGLRAGSPVRIAGLDVGTVDDVSFGEDGKVHVKLEVRQDASEFVREGSTARVGSKGLLGDQLVDITVGQGERLRPGSTIPSAEESLLTTFLGTTGTEAEGVVRNVNTATAALAQMLSNPETQQDVQDLVHNLATMSNLIAENDGTIRRLMTDPALANDVQGTIRSFQGTGNELERAARDVRQILGEVQHGDGTAHQIIYGEDGVRMLGSFADAAGQLATILRDVRTGNGNAHQLLYGDEAGNLIANLTATSADLRAVMADVRAGRGTIGGLLVDPSIYEDIKSLVGNLQRNEILRALVRFSIRHDRPAPPTPEAEPQASE
jgi:phospholipid/cholesterol/gamma-HCH transport system substrate-binding protein